MVHSSERNVKRHEPNMKRFILISMISKPHAKHDLRFNDIHVRVLTHD